MSNQLAAKGKGPILGKRKTSQLAPILNREVFVEKTTPIKDDEEFQFTRKKQIVDLSPIRPQTKRKSSRAKRSSSVMMFLGRSVSGEEATLSPPHLTIHPKDYSKWIPTELPGPLRLKHLVLWTIKYLLHDGEAKPDLVKLEEAIVKGELSLSWYGQSSTSLLKTKPNPLNEATKESIKWYKAFYKAVQNELRTWESLIQSCQQPHPTTGIVAKTPLKEEFPLITQTEEYCNSIQNAIDNGKLQLESILGWSHRLPFRIDSLNYSLNVCHNVENSVTNYTGLLFRDLIKATTDGDGLLGKDAWFVLKALAK